MLVDLHAHYAMHLQPSEHELSRESFKQWRREAVRALIVRTLSRLFNYEGKDGRESVTLEQMQKGNVGVILSPLYLPLDEIDLRRRYGARPQPIYFTDLLDQLKLVEDDIAGHEQATIAHSPDELEAARDAEKLVLIHAVEGGFHLGDDEDTVRANVAQLAERGVAYITVAHLFWRGVATNAPALPFMPDWLYSVLFPQPQEVGLSELGRAAVNAMLDHGVLIDITHMSERAMLDTFDLVDERDPTREVPVIATHMACRLGSLEYNLSEEIIKRVGQRGGLLGLIACKHYISDGRREPKDFAGSVDLLCEHIDRICKVTGSNSHVAFGSDLDGWIKPALPGLETLGHMGELQRELAKRYDKDRAEAFTSGNALRVLSTAWQRALPPPPGPPAPPPGAGDEEPPPPTDAGSGARGALELIAFALGFVGYLYLAGWLFDSVRLSSARLPAYIASDAFGAQRLIGDGLRVTLLAAGGLALVSVVAYFASALHWVQNGPLWHNLIGRHVARPGERRKAPLGEVAVRILAGFSSVTLAAIIALAPARLVDAWLSSEWWAVLTGWVVGFLAVYFVVTHWAPKIWGTRTGTFLWLLIGLASLFASAPIGVLVLANVFVATFGRLLARLERPSSIGELVRSPLPWGVLAVVMIVALAYQAMPPESFPTAVLSTPSGAQTGAYIARTSAGVYIGSCTTSVSDATSTDEHVTFVPAGDITSLDVRSSPYRFDTGRRPSLLTLAFRAIGGEGDAPTLFHADLRSRASTCNGAGTEGASNDLALGKGVLAGPGSESGPAKDGEAPIEEKAPYLIAQLARLYQPTLLTTTADRFWPVSVKAVLAESGPSGRKTCLVAAHAPKNCELTPESLSSAGATESDFLQLPVKLAEDSSPQGQFEAFTRGQGLAPGPSARWLADPGVLEPWNTAQIYFYLTDHIDAKNWPTPTGETPDTSGLIGLEYWFYYPYNYYPTAVQTRLMEQTPLAAVGLNLDLHQGDWEHIDVLIDAHTFKPKWLYMARHAFEGQFIPWLQGNIVLDEGHPVVQAAYGGHPTYPPGCGAQPRVRVFAYLTDWLVCGAGRLAFKARSTPLVDLARVPWACWPGHFGEASSPEIAAAGIGEAVRDATNKLRFVAGPTAPLRQAENKGVCKSGPLAGEESVLPRLQAARASSAGR
jgi:microsomal dipeptidase-like Zn-dependent dipeptidase